MKVVFFGTPEYILPIARRLAREFNKPEERGLMAVVTQPPKPIGRGRERAFSAVDTWAFKRGTPIIHSLDEVPEADLGIVAAYGNIIPSAVIKRFKYGILNIHPSLLPKYRGASPIQTALANGDIETGVSIIKMDDQMDHGPIVSSFKEKIKDTDNNESLRDRLFERATQFLIDLIPNFVNGKIKPKPQDDAKATFTKVLDKDSGHIKTSDDPAEIERKCRAFTPWPGVWTFVKLSQEFKRLKILKCHLEDSKLVLDEVQLEGKNPVSWKQFTEGHPNYKFEN